MVRYIIDPKTDEIRYFKTVRAAKRHSDTIFLSKQEAEFFRDQKQERPLLSMTLNEFKEAIDYLEQNGSIKSLIEVRQRMKHEDNVLFRREKVQYVKYLIKQLETTKKSRGKNDTWQQQKQRMTRQQRRNKTRRYYDRNPQARL